MDTGVGRTSYSIMAQGQIDQVLSSKPEDRRAVFEEAAGITKYKSQRREAMGKLALTDQNLARVADVVGEVGRQIGSLRRQAAKAMRYKRLGHRLRHLSLAWSAVQHARLAQALGALEQTLSGLRSEADRRRAALEGRQGSLDARKDDRSRLNQRVQDAQQAVYDLRSQREQAENKAGLAQVRRTGLSERLDGARDTLGELEMQLREVAAQVDTGSQDKQLQLGLLGSSDAVYQQHNRELAVSEGELGKLERDLQQAKFELLQFDSAVARLRTESSSHEVEQKTSSHSHEALAGEHRQASEHSAAAEKAAADAAARAEESLAARSRASEAAAAAQQGVAEATREFREGQRRLQETDRQIAQRGARLRLLQQLQERWEGFGEGAKAVLQGRLAGALAGSKATPVSQGIEVKAEFGHAVESLLGSAAEAIQVSDLATARRIFAQLEQEQIGSVILRIDELGAGAGKAEPLPPGVAPATSALARIDDGHPALAILASCYIADDLGAFLEYWRSHPEFAFLAVATRKGEVVDRRGLVSAGHANPKKQANSIVQREIDLRETAKALAEDQRRHDELRAQGDSLGAAITAAEQALEERRAAVLTSTQALAAAQAEERGARRLADEASSRVGRMGRELSELESARLEAQARWEKARDGLVRSEAAAAAHRRRIEELESRLAAVRAERDVKRETLAQARLELAERRQKVEILDKGLGEMERRRAQIGDLLLQRQQEIEAWTGQIADLEREESEERSGAARIGDTLSIAQEQVEKIRLELVGVEQEIGSLEASQSALRQESDAAHEELSAHEVRLAESRQRAVFLAEEVGREFQADVAAVEWRQMLWRADGEPAGLKALDLDEEEDAEPSPRRSRKKRPEDPTRGGPRGARGHRLGGREGRGRRLAPADGGHGGREPGGDRGVLGAQAAARLPEDPERRPHPGKDGADRRDRRDQPDLAETVRGHLRADPKEFRVHLPDALRGRPRVDRACPGRRHPGERDRHHRAAARHAAKEHLAAVRGPEDPYGRGASLRALPGQALAVLPPRRARRPARRVEYRPLHRAPEEVREGLPVHHHDPQQEDRGRGERDLRRHDGGAGCLKDCLDAVQPRARGAGGATPPRRSRMPFGTPCRSPPRRSRRAPEGASHDMAKWLLVDGFNLAYRCFFAIPELTRADGFPTNALHGWVKSIWRLSDQEKPDGIARLLRPGGRAGPAGAPPGVQGAPGGDARGAREADPGHQGAHPGDGPGRRRAGRCRERRPACVGGAGARAQGRRGPDRELGQGLRADRRGSVRIMLPPPTANPKLGWRVLDETGVVEKFGVAPGKIADYLALVGDTSDNIPGLGGVGPKTASKWLAEHGSLEGVIAAADRLLPERFRALVASSVALLRRNLRVTTLNVALPPPALRADGVRAGELYAILESMEMRSSLAEARQRYGQPELF